MGPTGLMGVRTIGIHAEHLARGAAILQSQCMAHTTGTSAHIDELCFGCTSLPVMEQLAFLALASNLFGAHGDDNDVTYHAVQVQGG